MMDDAVAILILEKIENILEAKGIEAIIGETDVDYCYSELNEVDIFYIIDSTYYGNTPGTLTFKRLDDMKMNRGKNKSIHSLGLIDLINVYKMNIKGYFIGIEIEDININIGLSHILQEKINFISKKILSFILYV